jgi:hypothetical protein
MAKLPKKKTSTKPPHPTDTSSNLKRPATPERPVRINFDLERPEWRELKRRAVDEDKSVAELMRELSTSYLSD